MHGEQTIEECVLWRGGLEARQRAKVVIRVVAHAGERHVNQGAVIRLERHPQIEVERSVGPRGHPVAAAGEHLAP